MLRETLWRVSSDKGTRGCGKSVIAGGVTPTVKDGSAYFTGVTTCGKVHLCPVCAAKIRQARATELQNAGTAWERYGQGTSDQHGNRLGGGLAMMTLTMRHYDRQSLRSLVKLQRDAWKLAFGQNAGRAWRDAKAAFGVVGYVRAWEVTHGENGWHPHYHVLLFLDRPLSPAAAADLQTLAFGQWSTALRKVGAYLPAEFAPDGRPLGVRIDAGGTGDGGTLARYLMKYQEAAAWSIGNEMTRQDIKQGRAGHRLPFEILKSIRETGDAAEVDLWSEFERGAYNIRALYWSQGLRKLLEALVELDERSSSEIAAETPEDGTPLAVVPTETWYRHVVRHDGRPLAMLRAAEALGGVGVRTLVESWGLVWGVDVLPVSAPQTSGNERVSA